MEYVYSVSQAPVSGHNSTTQPANHCLLLIPKCCLYLQSVKHIILPNPHQQQHSLHPAARHNHLQELHYNALPDLQASQPVLLRLALGWGRPCFRHKHVCRTYSTARAQPSFSPVLGLLRLALGWARPCSKHQHACRAYTTVRIQPTISPVPALLRPAPGWGRPGFCPQHACRTYSTACTQPTFSPVLALLHLALGWARPCCQPSKCYVAGSPALALGLGTRCCWRGWGSATATWGTSCGGPCRPPCWPADGKKRERK